MAPPTACTSLPDRARCHHAILPLLRLAQLVTKAWANSHCGSVKSALVVPPSFRFGRLRIIAKGNLMERVRVAWGGALRQTRSIVLFDGLRGKVCALHVHSSHPGGAAACVEASTPAAVPPSQASNVVVMYTLRYIPQVISTLLATLHGKLLRTWRTCVQMQCAASSGLICVTSKSIGWGTASKSVFVA
ncbi:hypothetical protein H310_12637 [Aphanomyces invadans]|uniref:Uncharacterized protein n=1 Tax=Aphanomyces invadans TaxID=157072 RepID=A0A024TGV9_9STRA|nr:hypothetical protein H310_12637 [Aphanomyces invadans]ETV93375.1 hypothetical protein H310_12637 [Aphanomyces invadans]|eukprot:XP_008878011.1 hypothetical protein H310_12637 [Aphanomyces invadans]